MPIEIQHGRAGTLLDAATASRQRGDQRVLDQRSFQRENREDEQAFRRSFQRENREDEQAFRQQENLRNRQQQVDMQESAEQARIELADQNAEIQKQQMADEYKRKDDYEKNQIDKQRSQYVHQRELIDNEYAGGNGKISYPQYIKALEDLNSQFGPMITSPVFGDVKKLAEEHPTMDINGETVKMAINPKTGKFDPHLTTMDWEKIQADKFKFERDTKKEQANFELKKEELKFKRQDRIMGIVEGQLKKEMEVYFGKDAPQHEANRRDELMKKYSASYGGTSGSDKGGGGYATGGDFKLYGGGHRVPEVRGGFSADMFDMGSPDPATISIGGAPLPTPGAGIDTSNIIGTPEGEQFGPHDPLQPTVTLPPKPPSASNPEIKDDPEINQLIGIIKSGGQLTAEQWIKLNDYRSKLK